MLCFFLYCDAWSCRCSCMGSMSVRPVHIRIVDDSTGTSAQYLMRNDICT